VLSFYSLLPYTSDSQTFFTPQTTFMKIPNLANPFPFFLFRVVYKNRHQVNVKVSDLMRNHNYETENIMCTYVKNNHLLKMKHPVERRITWTKTMKREVHKNISGLSHKILQSEWVADYCSTKKSLLIKPCFLTFCQGMLLLKTG
jgi:hypothetical protein